MRRGIVQRRLLIQATGLLLITVHTSILIIAILLYKYHSSSANNISVLEQGYSATEIIIIAVAIALPPMLLQY